MAAAQSTRAPEPMNFFEHQARARQRTRLLILLFLLAVAAIVAVVDLVVLLALGVGTDPESARFLAPDLAAGRPVLIPVSLLTVGVIGLASLLRILTLRSGGGAVARALGGVLVGADVRDPELRRLRNLVEEMSIASGVPVPQIYVLERENGINAFAAGYSPADAAIAVTRGAVRTLNRAELQGVIAHEFSHILNGDMRLNIHLMGMLFGILVLAMIGRLMLSARPAQAGKQGLPLAMIGLAVATTGWLGLFLGRWIRASVSRQREFLADASAVQFTREPQGIAGALKKIAAAESGSHLAADSEEIGHMLFAAGSKRRLFATHPPIRERIRALEPGVAFADIQGEIEVRQALRKPGLRGQGLVGAPSAEGRTPPSPLATRPAAIVATPAAPGPRPDAARLANAAALSRAIPAPLARAARSPEWVIAMVCTLVMDADPEIRERQRLMIAETFGSEEERRVGILLDAVPSLAAELRIPLLEIGFPTLRRRPQRELDRLPGLLDRLIRCDGRVQVFEYVLARLLGAQIRDAAIPAAARPAGTARLSDPAREQAARDLLLILAVQGHPDDRRARTAFAVGLATLGLRSAAATPIGPADWPRRLDAALAGLDELRLEDKARLLRALTASLGDDGATPAETELLRAVVAALRIPLPVPVPA